MAFVERTLAYHFALYMVRLTRVLYRELDWAVRTLWPERGRSPWTGLDLSVRYHERLTHVPREFHLEYSAMAERLNEAYILLPVLNNIELAVRAVSMADGGQPARMTDGCWAEAKQELQAMEPEDRTQVREVLAFLAQMGRHHVGLDSEPCSAERFATASADLLFDAVRLNYTAPRQRVGPRNHHQTVFDTVAGAGPTSFLQRQPYKHIVLGDELIYLLVLTLFEHRDPLERGDSTCVPREGRDLRRRRLPLRELEERLEKDLLVPASDVARRDLRASLARLGLVDRLSDVGEGNFLRHPTGI